jgi:hypothetical protein
MRIVINLGNGKTVEAEGKDIPEFEKSSWMGTNYI